MLKYKQIWHGIKPIKWLIKFNLTKSINLLKVYGLRNQVWPMFYLILRKMIWSINLSKVRVSTGWFGSGLCPTRNQPDDIEFPARKPVADHKNQWVRLGRICLIGGRIGWSWRRCCQSFLLAAIYIFRLIFVGSERKTPNRHRIYAKLTRSEQKNTKSLLDMHKTQEI